MWQHTASRPPGIPTTSSTLAPAFETPQLNLLSWNIAKGRHPQCWQDLQRLGHTQELWLLQETPDPTRIYPSLYQQHCWAFAPGYVQGTLTTGVMTAARARTESQHAWQHQEPWLRTPKAGLITRYRLCGQLLWVVNLHALNFSLGTRHFDQQLRQLAEAVAHHPGALLFGGDLNTWRRRRQQILTDITQTLGLQALPFDDRLRRRTFGLPLDHLFQRGFRIDHLQVAHVRSSDHNPLLARLTLHTN